MVEANLELLFKNRGGRIEIFIQNQDCGLNWKKGRGLYARFWDFQIYFLIGNAVDWVY
jgi:hypothetical protein